MLPAVIALRDNDVRFVIAAVALLILLVAMWWSKGRRTADAELAPAKV